MLHCITSEQKWGGYFLIQSAFSIPDHSFIYLFNGEAQRQELVFKVSGLNVMEKAHLRHLYSSKIYSRKVSECPLHPCIIHLSNWTLPVSTYDLATFVLFFCFRCPYALWQPLYVWWLHACVITIRKTWLAIPKQSHFVYLHSRHITTPHQRFPKAQAMGLHLLQTVTFLHPMLFKTHRLRPFCKYEEAKDKTHSSSHSKEDCGKRAEERQSWGQEQRKKVLWMARCGELRSKRQNTDQKIQ